MNVTLSKCHIDLITMTKRLVFITMYMYIFISCVSIYHRWGKIPGLNICGFSAIKVFVEILSHCLGHKCSLFSTNKERHLYSWKNVCGTAGTPGNHEKCENLFQWIFPHLRYVLFLTPSYTHSNISSYVVLQWS